MSFFLKKGGALIRVGALNRDYTADLFREENPHSEKITAKTTANLIGNQFHRKAIVS